MADLPLQPHGRCGMTWSDAIQGLRDVLADDSRDAVQKPWQRFRILDAIDLMTANAPSAAPAPAGGPAVPEGREPAAVAGEPSDEELLEIKDGAYCPSIDEVNDEDDSSWRYTSDYIRWLDENGTPQEQEAYAAKGLRAVFEAGRRWGRAALDAAPPEGPSLEEVEDLCEEHCFNVEGYESVECLQGLLNDAISRWGRPATPPAPAAGEVRELVAWLRDTAAEARISGDALSCAGAIAECRRPTRAADLLERQQLRPVAVAERPWEREGWCDAAEYCWFFFLLSNDPTWTYEHYTSGLCGGRSHSLPHDALPLPEVAP